MPKPNKRKRHLIKRIKERISSVIPIKELEGNLNHSRIMFAKKLTKTRSLGYMVINNVPVKFIYSKISKKIITVFKIYHDFEFPVDGYLEFHSCEEDDKSYRLKLYPDAYIETGDPRALTIFETLENNEWTEQKKMGEIFFKLFLVAWGHYEQTKKIFSNNTIE